MRQHTFTSYIDYKVGDIYTFFGRQDEQVTFWRVTEVISRGIYSTYAVVPVNALLAPWYKFCHYVWRF